MTKKLIDIDDELLARAREILGTNSQRETVTRALDQVVNLRRRLDFLEMLKDGALTDLSNPEIMAGAWRT